MMMGEAGEFQEVKSRGEEEQQVGYYDAYLLVPRKLLQRFFYFFSCFLIGYTRIISKVESNMVFWTFFRAIHVFVYLQRCNRNNTRDKQRNKFWREKMLRKPNLKLLR